MRQSVMKMSHIKRILCPVDMSHGSAESLRYGLALARAYIVARPLKPATVVRHENTATYTEACELTR